MSGAAAPGATGSGMAPVDPGWQYGTYEVTVQEGAAPNVLAVVVRGRDANNYIPIGPDPTRFYRMWKVVTASASRWSSPFAGPIAPWQPASDPHHEPSR